MFNIEIEKYWKVLNMRLSRAEYLLKREFPNLDIDRFNQNREEKVDMHFYISPKPNSNVDSSTPKRIILEITNEFLLEEYKNLFGVYSEDKKLSDVKFAEALELLYLRSSFYDPVDFLCDYKFVMTPFSVIGSNGAMLTRTDFSIALKRAGVSETGKTTHDLLENLDDTMDRVISELEKMR